MFNIAYGPVLSLHSASLFCTFKNVSISHSLQLRLAGFWHSILLLYTSHEVWKLNNRNDICHCASAFNRIRLQEIDWLTDYVRAHTSSCCLCSSWNSLHILISVRALYLHKKVLRRRFGSTVCRIETYGYILTWWHWRLSMQSRNKTSKSPVPQSVMTETRVGR